MRTIIALLVFCSLALSAPLPRKAPKPVEEFKWDGKYKLMWGGSEWIMYFDKKSGQTHSEIKGGHCPWDGSFTWDAKERILVIHEKPSDPELTSWMLWQVTLDKGLKGTATITNPGNTKIEVELSKE